MSQNIYFTPGPSQLFYTVQDHIKNALKQDIGAISHRGKAFQSLYQSTQENLRELLDVPKDYDIFFLSSATEIWERIIQNLVDQSSYHFVNGSFSKRFYQFTQDYQKQSKARTVEFGSGFDQLDIPEEAELIAITKNETSTGFSFHDDDLMAIRQQNPGQLIALDVVSSIPAVPLDFDLVDTAYFSVQKCFGLPAGLGVWMVNQRCYDQHARLKAKGKVTGSYHSLDSLKSNGEKHQTPETPNALNIYLLGKVAEDMLRKGPKMIENETNYKSALLYQTFEQHDSLLPFIKEKKNRSKTVAVGEVDGGNEKLMKYLADKKMITGSGYGPFKKDHIRIANFPTHSKEQVELLCDTIASFS
ncbi:MAG: aminotransferase class V-fold PLP-dependent enzyme [Cyclobacteriaceae bacterium]|nr:aminotransferase class V-fold PLP-dependent enzyme [Cyclobacteriaceae bacterium HetDA_MAG_MS6]